MQDMIRWTLVVLLVLVGGYILLDHGRHVAPYLPFAFLSGCLFMHMFMHRGHGHSDHSNEDQTRKEK